MAAPSEVLGPYPCRGLSDHPDRAPYGSAMVAENIDLARGDLRPRGGTKLVCNPTANPPTSVDLVASLGGMLVVVCRMPNAGTSDYYDVSVWAPGNLAAPAVSYTTPVGALAGRRCHCIEFGRKLLVFLPWESDGCRVLAVTDSPATITRFLFAAGVSGLPGMDEGPFYESDPVAGGDEPAGVRFAIEHKSRLFYACANPDRVIYSAAGYADVVAKTNEIALPTGGPITGMASYAGNLLVSQRDHWTVIEFSAQGASQMRPILVDQGAKCQQGLVQVGPRLLLLIDGGLVAIDQTGAVVAEVTSEIDETMRRLQQEYPLASVVHYAKKGQVWALFPMTGAIYVFNYRSTSTGWSGDWTAIRLACPVHHNPDRLCTLSMVDLGEGPVPAIGLVDENGLARVVLADQENQFVEWSGFLYKPIWLSNPIMTLGHNQRRVFRYLRSTWVDCGDVDVTLFWSFEGQEIPDALITGQSVTVSMMRDAAAPHARLGWPGGAETDGAVMQPPTPPSTTTGYVAYERGEQYFNTRASLGGARQGRWFQWGVRGTAVPFVLKRWELDTRHLPGRR